MNSIQSYGEIDQGFKIELIGKDALQVANNLTTNDLSKLAAGEICESFVTNVKGWVVAHCVIKKTENAITLWGMHPEPQSICDHVDRYVIREDVEIVLAESKLFGVTSLDTGLSESDGCEVVAHSAFGFTGFLSVPAGDITRLIESLSGLGWRRLESSEAEALRIKAGWPKQGQDFQDKTIPQELDRTEEAISFTKGCYLGQETIARLDALGKLQKKLCVLEVATSTEVGTDLEHSGQVVGQVTSLAQLGDKSIALAILKRAGFEAEEAIKCNETDAVVVKKS